jgi:GYF domain/mRNA biogenesis factor/WW domain binding protein 11
MGKEDGSGGLTDWHRKQRKKQVAKNKVSRIAARDERVKDEKSVQEVKDEIRKLEKQYKNEEQRPHNIKSKLDRLTKELKIVEKVEEERKKDAERNPNNSSFNPAIRPYYECAQHQRGPDLSNPAVSIYYDPVMNPYGAPPPGKPRLYHRRGGGVTMNLDEAGVPGEISVIPPPPPPIHSHYGPTANNNSRIPLPQHQHSVDTFHREGGRSNQPLVPSSSSLPIPQQYITSVHPPPPLPPPPPPPPRISHGKGLTKEIPEISQQNRKNPGRDELFSRNGSKIDPSHAPTLPKPSAAVERSRSKKRLAADIWASTEEIEYEEIVSTTGRSLEGTAESTSSKSRKDSMHYDQVQCWKYKDTSGNSQGPFEIDQMKQWIQAGFFPPHTLVQPIRSGIQTTSSENEWIELHRVDVFHRSIKPSNGAPVERVDSPINHSVQDRINMLRQQNNEAHDFSTSINMECSEQETSTSNLNENESYPSTQAFNIIGESRKEDSIESRIAALKSNVHLQVVRSDKECTSGDDVFDTTKVQDRIDNLQHQKMKVEVATENSREVDVLPIPPPPPKRSEINELITTCYTIDNIAANEFSSNHADKMSNLRADDENDFNGYPVSDDYHVNDEYPVNDDYPVNDNYPVNDDYPVDDNYPVNDDYPVDDNYPVIDSYATEYIYPVDDEYPIDDGNIKDTIPVTQQYPHGEDVADTYPAVGTYPVETDVPSSLRDVVKTKKKVKVEKDLVAFLPSHLLKSRTEKKKGS